MEPGFQEDDGGPAIDYLLKEVQYSTCDNRFFGELEKEMLVPNNVVLYGRVKGAKTLLNHLLRVSFPEQTAVGYVKQPLSNTMDGGQRLLTYRLRDLVNYEDYWWLPLNGETEFNLQLSLLPPFPRLQTIGLDVTCRPDIALGINADVTTSVRLEAFEDVDYISLSLAAPLHSAAGISMEITEYSDDSLHEPRQMVTSPRREFPYPRLSMKKGETMEYNAKTRITADPSKMNFLRCQQDIMGIKLLALSNSTPTSSPCSVSIIDQKEEEMPVGKTVRSTVMQANAQIMYSPFSIRRDKSTIPVAAVPAQ